MEEFFRALVENPLFIFLFGGGGILAITIAVIALIRKGKSKNNDHQADSFPPTQKIPIEITVKPVEPLPIPEKTTPAPSPIAVPRPSKKYADSGENTIIDSRKASREIDFVKNLINKSPSEDIITIDKIKNPQDYF